MNTRVARREAAIDRMADHVLSEGLAAATLRPLAAAAGTSDRMLLYYFANKDDLITAVLERISSRLLAALDSAIVVGHPRSFGLLLEEVWEVLRSPTHRPYMNIWYDLVAGAARGHEPHRTVAGSIADGYLAWVTARLIPEADASPSTRAQIFLAALQGMYLLDAIGRPGIAADAMNALQW